MRMTPPCEGFSLARIVTPEGRVVCGHDHTFKHHFYLHAVAVHKHTMQFYGVDFYTLTIYDVGCISHYITMNDGIIRKQ
jgi:hypothetical protein